MWPLCNWSVCVGAAVAPVGKQRPEGCSGVAPVGDPRPNDGPQPDGGERQLLRRRDRQAENRSFHSAPRYEAAAHCAPGDGQFVRQPQARLAIVKQTGLREARRTERRK